MWTDQLQEPVGRDIGQKAGSYEPVAGKTIHKVRGNNGLVETRGDEDLNIDAEDGYRG